MKNALNRSLLTLSLLMSCMMVEVAYAIQDEIKKKQSELEKVRDEIREHEEKIREQQRSEKATLDLVDSYDRKATAVRRLIGKLRAAERDIQRNIEQTRGDLRKLEDQLNFLKTHYAKYVSSVYKSGRVYDLELLLSSRSINQFYIRTEYLKRFSEQRKSDAEKINNKKGEIEERQLKLQSQLGEERRLIAEKGAEEDRYSSLAAERKDVLAKIRKDRRSIQAEIDRKRKAAQQLEGLITSLIDAERIRKEKATAGRDTRLPQPAPATGTFEARRGKLRWPVSQGAVIAKFGDQRHPTLKTVTTNTGIDIAVKAGTPVNSVADGEITRIWWLPGYGNLLIVDHSGGYRTVYAHLSEILVSEGQQVKEGDVIGASGEAVEGPRLHFEVWKDREKQNPEQWLSKN